MELMETGQANVSSEERYKNKLPLMGAVTGGTLFESRVVGLGTEDVTTGQGGNVGTDANVELPSETGQANVSSYKRYENKLPLIALLGGGGIFSLSSLILGLSCFFLFSPFNRNLPFSLR